MKKFRFALLALVVAVFSFAFTTPQSTSTLSTVYAFDANGNFLGSGEYATLDAQLCPGSQVFCAQVWTSITPEEQPAGTRLEDMKKSSGQ